MKKNTFPKHEKLKYKKQIKELFENGKWKSYENLRIVVLESPTIEQHKIGVSVSKKLHKKAKDRNRIKRLLREAYRLNKELYLSAFGKNTISMLFWSSKEIPNHFKIVEKQFVNFCESEKL